MRRIMLGLALACGLSLSLSTVATSSTPTPKPKAKTKSSSTMSPSVKALLEECPGDKHYVPAHKEGGVSLSGGCAPGSAPPAKK